MGPWGSSMERSDLASVCCSCTSNSFLELKFREVSRSRAKTEVFFAVSMWKSDPQKDGNWSDCPQNDRVLIISTAHGIAAGPGVMTSAITPQNSLFLPV